MDRSQLMTNTYGPPVGVCYTKVLLFICVSVFVLYLPLGDPDDCKSHINCCECPKRLDNFALCCLCSIYKVILRVLDKFLELLDSLLCVVFDVLYQAKLKFYKSLEKYDKKDLCTSVCNYREKVYQVEQMPCRCSHQRPKKCRT